MTTPRVPFHYCFWIVECSQALEEINSEEYHGGWKGIYKEGKTNSDPQFIQ